MHSTAATAMESASTTATHVNAAAAAHAAMKAAHHATTESAAHRRRVHAGDSAMKTSAGHSSRMKTTRSRHSAMKTSRRTGMESTRAAVEPARVAVESSARAAMEPARASVKPRMRTIVDMEIIMHKAAMRKETAMREKDSAKPARERIKECRRIPTADPNRRRIYVATIAANIGHGRSGLRRIRTGIRVGRRFGHYRRLSGICLGCRRRGHRSSMGLVTQLRAAFQHRRQFWRGNSHVAQLDDFVRRRFKRPRGILDERQNNRLVHAGFGKGNDVVDSAGKWRSSAGRNRARIGWLSGIRLNRARNKAGTGDHAAEEQKVAKTAFS